MLRETRSDTGTIRAAIGHAGFRRLLTAMAVSQVGDWLYNVALLVFVYDATGSAGWVAAATVIRLVPYVVGSPIGGLIADSMDRRAVLVVSDLLRAGLMGLLAAVAAFDGPVVLALLLAALTTAAGTAYLPTYVTAVPELVGENDLAAANSAGGLVENLSVIVGPAIGAVLLAIGSPTFAFALNAVSFGVGALLASSVTLAPRVKDSDADDDVGLARRFREGWDALRGSRQARVLSYFLLGSSFLYGAQTVVLVLAANETLHSGSDGVGILYVALGIGGLAAATSVSRLARVARLGPVLFLGLVVCCVPVALLAVVTQPAAGFGLMVVSGAGMVVVDVLGLTVLQRVMSAQVLGRVWGILDALIVLAILVGSLVVGPLVSAFGVEGAFVAVGLVIPVLATTGARALAEVDRSSDEMLTRLAPVITAFEGLSILDSASRGVVEVLARDAVEVRFPAGAEVIVQGNPAAYYYVVASGSLEVLKDRPGADRERVASLAEGDDFGEIGLLSGVPRTATVRATSDVVLWRVDGAQFLDAINGAPTMSASMMERAAVRLAAQDRSAAPAT